MLKNIYTWGVRIGKKTRRPAKIRLLDENDGTPTAIYIGIYDEIKVRLIGDGYIYDDAACTINPEVEKKYIAGERFVYFKINRSGFLVFSDVKKIYKISIDNKKIYASLKISDFKLVEAIYFFGADINIDLLGRLPESLKNITIVSNTIKFMYKNPMPNNIERIYLNGNNIYFENDKAYNSLNYLILIGNNINYTNLDFSGSSNFSNFYLYNFRQSKLTDTELITLLTSLTNRVGGMPDSITIGDYTNYSNPPQSVVDAINLLKITKNITNVYLYG